MPTPAEFLEATKYFGIATLVMAGITLLAFALGWGFRFRLVGITSFITGGMLGLSFEPFTPTVVPGSIPYKTVYDSGAAQIVVKVSDTVTPNELEATLQQAASNLLKPSRLGGMGVAPTIRARAIVHAPGGVSNLVYLGQVQPIRKPGAETDLAIEIFENAFDTLAQASSTSG